MILQMTFLYTCTTFSLYDVSYLVGTQSTVSHALLLRFYTELNTTTTKYYYFYRGGSRNFLTGGHTVGKRLAGGGARPCFQ